MSAYDPARLARKLYSDRHELRSFLDIPAEEFPVERADAYIAQEALIGIHLEATKGSIAGWKVALTNPAMQEAFGVDEPAEGAIFSPLIRYHEARVPAVSYLHLGAEGEIVLRMKDRLSPDGAPFDAASVASAVGSVMPGIEIVDDRNAGSSTKLGMLIADNAMNYGCVLGNEVPYRDDMDLEILEGKLRVNGEPAGEGRGANAYGGPLQALAWLANSLAQRGRSLEPNDVVMSGSLALTVWPEAGHTVSWTVEGVGDAELRVEA